MNTSQYQSKIKPILILSSMVLLSILGIVFNRYFEQKIFPSITTPITFNKHEAIDQALALNKKSTLGLPNTAELRAAASYLTDSQTNNYLSLQDKSNTLLNESIKNKSVHTSFWAVRLFISENIQENYYYFVPNGSQLGFELNIPQDKSLPNLSKAEAVALAQKKINTYHIQGINPANYQLKDYSEEKLPNRVDHILIFENTKQSLREAKLQITAVVSGDQISKLTPDVKLPENFSRDFAEMMSFNNTLGMIGNIIIVLGYGGIILFALYQGQKTQNLNWQGSLAMTGIITLFLSLNTMNLLPLLWFSAYQTTQSITLFLSNNFVDIIYQAINTLITLGPCLVAGEYLDRKTFPNHIHVWSWWHTESASSKETSFLILLAYIIFGITVGYQSIFYLVAQSIPNVWIPTGPLFNPDFISTYVPSLYSFSLSLQAGTLEECLFRAVPIASAVLIGLRYKRLSLAIAIIIPLQAILFGLAHSSYPQQPFYIRTLELFVPFLGYGFVYLKYGLVPCIIAHYLFDVYQFSMIIFNMNTNMIWIQQSICILWLLIPAIITIKAKIVNKVIVGQNIPERFLNKNWQPPTALMRKQIPMTKKQNTSLSTTDKISSALICVLATGIMIFSWTHSLRLTAPLQMSKSQALKQAQQTAQGQFLDMSKKWTINQTAELINNNKSIRFLTEHIGQSQLENLLRNPTIITDNGNLNLKPFLPHYAWVIRYALFSGSQTDRSEELIIDLSDHHTAFDHNLSENVEGKSITEEQALKLSHNQLRQDFGDFKNFELIKQSSSVTTSNRVDWQLTFQFKTPPQLENIKPRVDINISGDRITGKSNYLFIPEKWQQAHQINLEKVDFLKTIISMIKFCFFIFIIVIASKSLTVNKVNFVNIKYLFAGLFLLGTMNMANSIEELTSSFRTSINYSNQLLFVVTSTIISTIFICVIICILAHYTLASQKNYAANKDKQTHYLVGIGLGLGLSVTKLMVANVIAPENNWQFSNIEILSKIIPSLYSFSIIPSFLINSMSIVGVVLWSQQRVKQSITCNILAILAVTVFSHQLIVSNQGIITTPLLLGVDFIVVLAYITSIWPILKKQPLILPTMVAMTYICHIIISIKNPAFTGYNFVQLITAMTIMITSIALTTRYQKNQFVKARRR